jgi:hypothetical protein
VAVRHTSWMTPLLEGEVKIYSNRLFSENKLNPQKKVDPNWVDCVLFY